MKAVVLRSYGPPEALAFVDRAEPVPAPDQVVVRVMTSSVNPIDWHRMRGRPLLVRASEGLRRPKDERLGADFAGVVERVGSAVSTVRVGDEVFGFGTGAFAELIAVKAEGVVAKPPNVSFPAAGVVGVAALTALQGLQHHGRIAEGHRVLVSGAGGGVGSFAVQIAKALGAEVVATTSADRMALVRSLGADEVLDYHVTDPTERRGQFDLILDAGGWLSLRGERRALKPGGTAVLSGGGRSVTGSAIIGRMGGAIALTKVGSRRFVSFVAQRNQADLETLRSMLEVEAIRPVIERTYPFAEIADAIRYQETGRAAGKVAVAIRAGAGGETERPPGGKR
ncbi:MAG TPA: NAD(P)-dependent alcohol dehydrogenase [Candidatus Limnocylindrales bacterium]